MASLHRSLTSSSIKICTSSSSSLSKRARQRRGRAFVSLDQSLVSSSDSSSRDDEEDFFSSRRRNRLIIGKKEDFASRRRRIKTRAMSSSSSNKNVRNPHRAKPNVQYSTVELTSEYVLEKNFHPSYDHRNDPLRENDSRLNSLAFHHKNLEDVIALSETRGKNMVAPMTTRVIFPDSYDETRATPYPMVICVPGDPGYGVDYEDGYYHASTEDIAREGMVMALRDLEYHNKNDCIIVDLCFNTYTWMNDSCSRNHESYLMNVVLPELLGYEATNVGKISLIGYGTSGYGVLSLLYRHPDVFHRAVSADAPIWGGANEGREVVRKEYLESSTYSSPKGSEMEEITPPGEKPKSKQTKDQEDEEDEEAKEEKKRRRSLRYYDAFPDCGESFPDEHKVLLLAHADKNIEAFSGDPRVEQYPRLALIPMVEYGREVEWFSDAISNVTTHDVLTGHEEEEACHVGPWLATALDWLREDLGGG